MNNNSSTTGKVKFNFGQARLNLIAALSYKATYSYLGGDLLHWYYSLKAIKSRIISKINKTDLNNLNVLEKKIDLLIRLYSINLKNNSCKPKFNVKKALGDNIQQYDSLIEKHLDLTGFLVPAQKDRTVLFGQEEKTSVTDLEESFDEN